MKFTRSVLLWTTTGLGIKPSGNVEMIVFETQPNGFSFSWQSIATEKRGNVPISHMEIQTDMNNTQRHIQNEERHGCFGNVGCFGVATLVYKEINKI